MKVVTILGARPQFIKAAALSREIAARKNMNEVIVHTGQHYDANMSDVFFEEMEIPKPSFFLGINGVSHGAMTGQMLEKIEDVLKVEKPDYVVVFGDTNSTLAGALAAKKLHIKVAHVEAGLRSFNMKMPEEINRILTDRISDILFCPTDTAMKHLRNEAFQHLACTFVNSGDIMLDVAMFYKEKARAISTESNELIENGPFCLCTIHRAENTDDLQRLSQIFEALRRIADIRRVILPLHPRTQKLLEMHGISTGNIEIIKPVGYLQMVQLLTHCEMVLTDSGGLQKEAFFFGKFCVTIRDETEWVELVEGGFNTLTGANTEAIVNAVNSNLSKNFPQTEPYYGEGKTAKFICDFLESHP